MIIIVDTREKVGTWAFGEIQTVEKKLDSGDYSILGYEDIVSIERKKSVQELGMNVGAKEGPFRNEMERMKDIKYPYLILEFTRKEVMDFPHGSNLPDRIKSKVRTSGKFILKKLHEYEENYGVKVIFAGSRENAIEHAIEIFKYVEKTEI